MWRLVLSFIVPIGAAIAVAAWMLTRHGVERDVPAVSRKLKILSIACWVFGMTGILSIVVLVYGGHPTKPDLETHRTYSYNLHGTSVYLTKEEDSALTFFESMFGLGLVGFGVGVLVLHRQQQRAEDRKYVRPDS